MSSEVHGPIDTVVVQFPADSRGTATTRALVTLVELGTVRLYDLLVVRKDASGKCVEVDLDGEGSPPLRDLAVLSGARSGLLGSEDVDAVADVLDDDSCALAVVYENAWAVPFVAAAFSEGGELVASTRVTAQELNDSLDAAEAAE
jgi:hypothetical protein